MCRRKEERVEITHTQKNIILKKKRTRFFLTKTLTINGHHERDERQATTILSPVHSLSPPLWKKKKKKIKKRNIRRRKKRTLPVLITHTHKYKRRAAGCCRGGKWRVEREGYFSFESFSLSFLDLEPGKKRHTYIHAERAADKGRGKYLEKSSFFFLDGKPDE